MGDALTRCGVLVTADVGHSVSTGRLEIEGIDFDQREVTFAFHGRPDLAGDGIVGAQVETGRRLRIESKHTNL